MRKYPQKWIDIIGHGLAHAIQFGRQEEKSCPTAFALLENLEKVSALAPIPEPLEIEYCTAHMSKKHKGAQDECWDSLRTKKRMNILSSGQNYCQFIKMREVEE